MYFNNALNIFFPQKCGYCGKIGSSLCDNCEKAIKKFEIDIIQRENLIKNKKVNKFYIYRYESIIRELLIKYKFNDCSYLSDTFAKIISKNKKICRFLKNYDIIIPVPLHKKRRIERGYNQTELIVKKLKNIKVETKCLKKIKNIKPQSEKGLKDRIKDIKGVYKVENIDKIINKRVILFDDIYTTGSTINECIKELSKFTNDIGVLILAKDFMEVQSGRFS